MARMRKRPKRSGQHLGTSDRPRTDAIVRRPSTAVNRTTKLPTPKPKRKWVTSLLVLTVLLGSAGLVVGGAWLSLQMFLNPDAVGWVNQFLPEWAQIPLVNQPPQTLTQIQASLSKEGHTIGEPLPLDNTKTVQAVLIPVLSPRSNCQSDCEEIVELRVYQPTSSGHLLRDSETYYQLVSQLAVEGPEESLVLAPLIDAGTDNQGSTQPLPLTEVHRFEGNTPTPGIWLYLQGQMQQQGNAIAYGQVVYYNPDRNNLQLMLPWTSPAGQVPQWQRINGSSPELVVNQTIDLEPQLHAYRVKPVDLLNPIQLQEISLAEAALPDQAYREALLVARSGLWSPAWEWLQFIKRQRENREPWPAAAQVQMDLVQMYAQLTKAQADKTWASPSQQILADLIDGRWEGALRVFQTSPEDTPEIVTLLKTDSGRLWRRVEAALRVNPDRPEVEAWGAMITAAQHGQKAAIAWLNQQPQTTPATLEYIQPLLKQLNGELTTDGQSSRIVGSVEPLNQFNLSRWLHPDSAALKLDDQQVWYQVKVDAFHDTSGWKQAPFLDLQPLTMVKAVKSTLAKTENPVAALWHRLGLDANSQIQIVVWSADGQQQTTWATVKAVQLDDGVLRLLVASDPIPEVKNSSQPQPLALTEAALQWVQPPPTTLSELNQQQPLRVKAILPVLWRELQSGGIGAGAIPSLQEMQQQLGNWPVQSIDLTGQGKSETVLTVSPEAVAALNNSSRQLDGGNQRSRLHTLIFSPTGALIYSEFSTNKQQSVMAIANIQDGGPPALLVDGAKTYSLQRWSAKRQRFE